MSDFIKNLVNAILGKEPKPKDRLEAEFSFGWNDPHGFPHSAECTLDSTQPELPQGSCALGKEVRHNGIDLSREDPRPRLTLERRDAKPGKVRTQRQQLRGQGIYD